MSWTQKCSATFFLMNSEQWLKLRQTLLLTKKMKTNTKHCPIIPRPFPDRGKILILVSHIEGPNPGGKRFSRAWSPRKERSRVNKQFRFWRFGRFWLRRGWHLWLFKMSKKLRLRSRPERNRPLENGSFPRGMFQRIDITMKKECNGAVLAKCFHIRKCFPFCAIIPITFKFVVDTIHKAETDGPEWTTILQ